MATAESWSLLVPFFGLSLFSAGYAWQETFLVFKQVLDIYKISPLSDVQLPQQVVKSVVLKILLKPAYLVLSIAINWWCSSVTIVMSLSGVLSEMVSTGSMTIQILRLHLRSTSKTFHCSTLEKGIVLHWIWKRRGGGGGEALP